MHDANDSEARMLLGHFKMLKMILEDVKPADTDPPAPGQAELLDSEGLLSDTISLVTNAKIQQAKNYQIELGLIPPLFYLATNTLRCPPTLRRKAIQCLQYQLAERREGAWTGAQAGRVAAEIFNIQEELRPDSVLNGVSFEVFDHPSVHQRPAMAGIADRLGPELWICYHAASTRPSQENGASMAECQTQMRLCISWTPDELTGLPQNINELVRNCGYQGYFSDSVAAVSTV
jgi:hypothetical protein